MALMSLFKYNWWGKRKNQGWGVPEDAWRRQSWRSQKWMILDCFCEDDACCHSFLCNDIIGWRSSLKQIRNTSGKIKILIGRNYSGKFMWLNIGSGFKLARGVRTWTQAKTLIKKSNITTAGTDLPRMQQNVKLSVNNSLERGNEDTVCVRVCVEAGVWQKGY